MNQQTALVPDQPSIVEQWFAKMEPALARLSVLAGSGVVEDIKHVISHVRAARRERAERPQVDLRAELQTAVEEMQEAAADMRNLTGVLRAEVFHGRSVLTDWLIIDGARSSIVSVAPTLQMVDALLKRVDAIQAFPHELDALLESAAHQKQRP